MKFATLATLALSCASSVLASPASVHAVRRDHHERLHHGRTVSKHNSTETTLSKRFDGARMTYYSTGLGACGKTNNDGDFIVALNSAQYGGGQDCFKMITISYNGKSTQAQIVDECPGCPYGGLDLSPGLFSFFASEDAGVIYGTWVFGSGDPAPEPTTTKKKQTTTWIPELPTSTWKPEPTTTWTPEPSTSSTPEPTTSSTPSTSSTPTTSSTPSSTVESTSETPTPTPSTPAITTDNSAIDALYAAVIQFGGMIAAGAQANLQTSQS